MSRDVQRARVYAAEDLVARQLEWAACGASTIEVVGSRLTLGPLLRFGSLGAAHHWCERALSHPHVVARFGRLAAPELRFRRGAQRAHYQASPPQIALPGPVSTSWAMSELVLAHELTHHLLASHPDTQAGAAHGGEFTATLCWLLECCVSPELALLLRVRYADEGVALTAPPRELV